MTLLLGTSEGLYVAPDGDTRGADRALETPVNRIRRFEGPGVLAATGEGVYRSVGGREWTRLGTVGHPVHAVAATREGRIYAGTRPGRVYASDDGGGSWWELAALPTGRADRDPAVRALAADRERVLVGVDPGGVIVSEDAGEAWADRARGPTGGVAHLLGIGAGPLAAALPAGPGARIVTSVASAGDGLYRTDDAGETWQRLDGPPSAHLEAVVHDGRLFAAVRGHDTPVVVEYDLDEDTGTVRRVGSQSGEFVGSVARHMGRLLAGTVRDGGGGRVLVRNPDGTWSTLGETPAGVVSMVGI